MKRRPWTICMVAIAFATLSLVALHIGIAEEHAPNVKVVTAPGVYRNLVYARETSSVPVESPPPPGSPWPAESKRASLTRQKSMSFVQQAALENKDILVQNIDALLDDNFRLYNDSYVGLHTFGGDNIIEQLAANFLQLLSKWSGQACSFVCAMFAMIAVLQARKSFRRPSQVSLAVVVIMAATGFASYADSNPRIDLPVYGKSHYAKFSLRGCDAHF